MRNPVDVPAGDDDCYLNLLWFDRRKCLLLVHADTLFPVFVADVGNAGLTPLETWIGGAVVHELRREALSDDALGEIAGPVTGAKTASRQILGFMNEMAIHADCAIVDAGVLGVTPTYSTASCGACSTTATVGTPRRLAWSPSGARAVGMTHRANNIGS